MTRTLVCDLGGVLLRWQPAQLLLHHLPHRVADEAAAAALAVAFFETFRPGGDWAEFDRGRLDRQTAAARIAARLGLTEAEVQSVIDGVPAHLRLREEVAALLRELTSAGHRLVYLSNMPRPYVERVRALIDPLAFAGGLFSSDVGLVKPEPAIYPQALRQFGARAVDCLLLDDNPANVAEALRQGWQACHFSDAQSARDALVGLGWLGKAPPA